MKMFIKKNRVSIAFSIGILLTIATAATFIDNIRLSNILKEKPTNIVVANTSTTETNIYWKSRNSTFSRLLYKEKNSSSPYINVDGTSLYKDIETNDYIYEVKIENLKPDTEYSFYIKTPKKVWNNFSTFSTREIDETVALPKIKKGESKIGTFLLIQNRKENIMLYTQNYENWAISLDEEDYYTITEYGRYIPSMILSEKLRANILKLTSPIYASTGPNCKTNINRLDNQYDPKLEALVSIMETRTTGPTLIETCKGHHANECYNDVYCQSVEKGVHPALPITLWVHESAASMYAKYPQTEDFGIHGGGVPSRNFTKQLERLLDVQMNRDYISGYCTDKGLTAEERWATKYYKGYCNDTNIPAGQEYISVIRKYYNWLQGSNFPAWPWDNITPNPSACDRSKEVTNQVFRDCGASSIGNNPDKPDIPAEGDGIKDQMIISDENRKCEDLDGCLCLYDREGNNYKTQLDAKYLQICTTDKQVIDDPDIGKTKLMITNRDEYCTSTTGCVCYWDNQKIRKEALNNQTCTINKEVIETLNVCCLQEDELNPTKPYNCLGSIADDIPLNECKTVAFKYNLIKGVNFIKTYKVFDYELNKINTAHGLIEYSENIIMTIASFNNGIWSQIAELRDGEIYGTDFELKPGGIYLMIALEDYTLNSSGYTLSPKEIDLKKIGGWNLIPTSIFQNKAEWAYSMFENNLFDPIKQVALWNNNLSMFEYTVESSDESVIGKDVKLTTRDNIFINVIN